MSRQQIGGAVGAVVGAVVGYYTGNYQAIQYGYIIGSGVGALVEKPTQLEGPRVDTNALPTAAEGDPIPYVIGTARVAGVVAWMSAKRNVPTTTSEGKGGGVESTTYTAECDVLFVVACNRTAGVRRIWRYGELVWTLADSADPQSVADSATTDKWRRMTIYPGTDAQLPDPVYEAAVGVGNAPGYRYCTSIFFEGLQLGGGQQLPILNFEVLESAASGGGSDYIGNFPGTSINYYVGPMFVDDNGITVHQTYFASSTTFIQRMSFDGSTITTLGSYPSELYPIPRWNFPVDESVQIVYEFSGTPSLRLYNAAAQKFSFQTSYVDARRFAKVGTALYASCQSNILSAPIIERFVISYGNSSVASSVANTGTLSYFPISICADATYVYALGTNRTTIDRFDATTLASAGAIALPVTSSVYDRCLVLLNEDGELFFSNSTSLPGVQDGVLYKYNGSTWDVAVADLDDCSPLPQGIGSAIEDSSVVYGQSLYRYVSPSAAPDAAGFPVYRTAGNLAALTRSLSDVVTEMVERTGLLTAADIDVSDITTTYMRGMKIDRPMSVRAVLDSLLPPFFVEAFEGDKITFRRRGGSAVLTIPYEDLGVSEGDAVEERLPITRANDIEVPARIYGRFPNWFDNHQVGKTPTTDRLTTDSLEERAVDIPVLMTPSEAAKVIDVAVMDLQIGRITLGPIAVTRKYAALDPTDVVNVIGPDGSSYRVRIPRITESGLVRTLELVSDDATALVSAAEADDTDLSTSIVRNNVAAEIEAMDTPILRDADDAPGHYERISAVGKWAGARLQRSIDQALWSDVEDVTDRATYGIAAGALPAWTGGNVIDRTSALTVDVAYGEFSSITRAAMLASRQANLIAVGAPGRWEYLQYQTATVVDADTVILSNLLRGRFGTDAETAAHAGGDRVVLMQPVGLRKVRSATSDIGVARYYRAISFGKLPSSANVETFTDMGLALRPYSATNPRVLRDSSNNATMSWHRRTRLATRFGGPLGSAVPLGEVVQVWSVDIFSSNTYTTVVRTITSSTSSVTYSAANQTTDGLTPGATIYARVYQLSATVGRGAPLSIAA